VGAVMEVYAVAQMEYPDLGVLRILLPLLGKPGTQWRQAVGPGQMPQHQPLENRVTEEAHPLKTVVGQPGWRGNVGRRHGDAQRRLGHRGLSAQQSGSEGERAGNFANKHDLSRPAMRSANWET